MYMTDSKTMYDAACYRRRQILNSRDPHMDHSGSMLQMDLEPYYIQIMNTMFYELVMKRSSVLLSELCSANKIQVDTKNYKIENVKCLTVGNYDLVPILYGINIAFTKSLEECKSVLGAYIKPIFCKEPFRVKSEYDKITDGLKELDKNIGRLLAGSAESIGNLPGGSGTDKTKEAKSPEIVLRIHDSQLTEKLNQLAKDRRANDSALSEQIQQLQMSLQDELKQIMSIREGIDYNITQEAISQFILLFSLVSETLQYHPNEKNKDSYYNLIESCEDFLENIKQSLAMLGVTIINDVGAAYAPERHRVASGQKPMRNGIVSKVVKIGFAYKNKVIEKAEVELAETKDNL